MKAYDVIVGGGGAAGVAAALGARRAGARTLLIERTAALGGAAVTRNVLTYCGLWTCRPEARPVVTGVASRLLERLETRGGTTRRLTTRVEDGGVGFAIVAVDPEAVKIAFDDMVAEDGVDVLLGATITDVARHGALVTGVGVQDFGGARLEFGASAVVDATGDAVLSAKAGAAVTRGSDGRTQTATLGVRFGGIPPTADVSVASVGKSVLAARRAGVEGLTSNSGFVIRLPGSGDVVTYLADEDLDALDAGQYADATRHARRQAWAYLDVIRGMPECGGAYIVSAGPELGIRESRHLVGRSKLRNDVLERGTIVDDAVALGAWPSEYHPGVGKSSEWRSIGGDGAYGITLDNLRSVDVDNVFGAGRVIGGEREAAASVRVMGTAMATGQAAGVAAAQRAAGICDLALTARTREGLVVQGATLSLQAANASRGAPLTDVSP